MTNNIIFNASEIDQGIKNAKEQEYKKSNNITFSFVYEKNQKEKNQKYFASIKGDNEQYIGILTDNFKKELFGYSLFNNGDEYFGEILKEKKEGFGIYKFKKGENAQNIYIGNFSNDKIMGEGIYINILESEPSIKGKKKSINLIKYNCYIGIFENSKFKKGKIYTFNKDLQRLNIQSEEEEEKVFSIESQNNLILLSKGIMKKGTFCEGIIINFIKDKDKLDIENKFIFKTKDDSNYEFEPLNDEKKEKEIIEEFDNYKKNYEKYNQIVNELVHEILSTIENFKKIFPYSRCFEVEKNFKEFFKEKYYNFLLFKSK